MIRRKVAAYINTSNLLNNYRAIRNLSGKAKVCAVVKADAYGHGAVAIARILEKAGADYLAVAFLEEAVELRSAKIAAPILVCGATDPANADIVVEEGLTQTVYTEELAEALSVSARKKGLPAKIHVKIDTGMHRQGIEPEAAGAFARAIRNLEGLQVEGAYSHFAEADKPDKSFTLFQLERFRGALDILNREGVHPTIRHIANSAGLLHFPESRMDMVRPGILLYGLSPDAGPRPPAGFLPVMRLCASIATIRTIRAGESVSYGRLFTASRPTRVALLQLGYADGYPRLLSNKASVLVRGRRAPVIGRICMDQCMIDVTDIPEARDGDEVTLFGVPELPAGELSRLLGTIDYEITCGISKRVPRIVEE